MVASGSAEKSSAAQTVPVLFRTGMLCAVLAMLSLLPLHSVLSAPLDRIPVTVTGSDTVPLFNAWTILWNSTALKQGFYGWWDAPIFFPEKRTFAFSEPMPMTALLQPLVQLFGSTALAYNCWLSVNLFLNGWLASVLLRRCGCQFWSAAAAGCAMTMLPLLQQQLEVLQLACLWPSIWLLSTLLQLSTVAEERLSGLRQPTIRILETTAAVICLPATCLHHMMFLGLLLLICGWVLIPLSAVRRWGLLIMAAGLLALPPVLLLVRPVQQVMSEHGFKRREQNVAVLSAMPSDYLRAAPNSLWEAAQSSTDRPWNLGPGWLRLLLACTAPILIFCSKSSRSLKRLAITLTLFSSVSFALSLGVNLEPGGLRIWSFLCDWLPGMAQVRSAFRFAIFFQAGVVLLAGAGIDLLLIMTRSAFSSMPRIRSGSMVCLVLLFVFESWPGRTRSVLVPRTDQISDWAQYLQGRVQAGEGILILPYVAGYAPDDFEPTVRWMIQSTAAGLRTANGYSGFFPATHYMLQQQLGQGLTDSLIATLRSKNIRWIVTMDSDSTIEADANGLLQWHWTSMTGECRIFEVTRAGRAVLQITTP